MRVVIPVLHAAIGIIAATDAGWARDGLLHKPDTWFTGTEGRQTLEAVLSWQAPAGGWPKNVDTTDKPYVGDPKRLRGTFDNGATTDDLRLLARAYGATQDSRCREAFLRGFDHILAAQYPSGGWPQFYPPGNGYHRYITFNDNTMVRLMVLLREIASENVYGFVDSERRRKARVAFEQGIKCILKCQVRVKGRLTVWCAQHDEVNYEPRSGRAYELVSLSGSESTGIVRLLMSLDDPSRGVIDAVEAAAAWFQSARLTGLRVVTVAREDLPGGKDKQVVKDPMAPPLWARFYDIDTSRPIFCDRDGTPRQQLSEIGHERRNGYAWLGSWPRTLLDRELPEWRTRWHVGN